MREQESQSDVVVGPRLGVQLNKKLSAVGHFEPSLVIRRIPRCPECEAANPRGMSNCQECGADAPISTDYQRVKAVLPVRHNLLPIHARILLWIGAMMRRFAEFLQRS